MIKQLIDIIMSVWNYRDENDASGTPDNFCNHIKKAIDKECYNEGPYTVTCSIGDVDGKLHVTYADGRHTVDVIPEDVQLEELLSRNEQDHSTWVGIKAEEGFFDLLPFKAHSNDACYDLHAAIIEPITLKPGKRALVSNGFKCNIPHGFEFQVRPRSGLAIKQGLTVLNAPGTIDENYKGVVGTVLINLGEEDIVIKRGDRVSQLAICKVANAGFEHVEDVGTSDRGEGGFGSTGVN